MNRFMSHFLLDYDALYTAWDYVVQEHYCYEDILKLRYLHYALFDDIALQLNILPKTATYYTRRASLLFIASYRQQTERRYSNERIADNEIESDLLIDPFLASL